MNRRCRQPSRQGLRCGGDPGHPCDRVVGTSAIRISRSVALITISDANSMPVVWSPSARTPRARSLAGRSGSRAPDTGRTAGRCPRARGCRCTCSSRASPRHDPAGKRLPITRSAPAQLLDKGIEPAEVVAVVAVAHDDVATARASCRNTERPRSHARAHQRSSALLSRRSVASRRWIRCRPRPLRLEAQDGRCSREPSECTCRS